MEPKVFQAIEELVCTWTPRYKYVISQTSQGAWTVTWSKPTAAAPIPAAVARATFEVSPEGKPTSYRIENQRFVHRIGEGTPFQESWVDSVIDGKLIAKDVAADLMSQKK